MNFFRPTSLPNNPKKGEKIDCIDCSESGYLEELKYSPMASMHECKCTSTYEEKRYYCEAILPGMKVLIQDPKKPPKHLCPCYTKSVQWMPKELRGKKIGDKIFQKGGDVLVIKSNDPKENTNE